MGRAKKSDPLTDLMRGWAVINSGGASKDDEDGDAPTTRAERPLNEGRGRPSKAAWKPKPGFEKIDADRAQSFRDLIAKTGWGAKRLSRIAIPGTGEKMEQDRAVAIDALSTFLNTPPKTCPAQLPKGLCEAVIRAIPDHFDVLTDDQIQRIRSIDYPTLQRIALTPENREKFGQFRLQEVNRVFRGETDYLQKGFYNAIIEQATTAAPVNNGAMALGA